MNNASSTHIISTIKEHHDLLLTFFEVETIKDKIMELVFFARWNGYLLSDIKYFNLSVEMKEWLILRAFEMWKSRLDIYSLGYNEWYED